jgi:hypothetical protein
VYILSSLCHQQPFGLQVVQCPYGSDSLNFQSFLTIIHLLESLCGMLSWFALFAYQKWRNGILGSILNFSLCWLCWSARYCIVQNMDDMDARWVFNVNFGMIDHFKQCKICILTITQIGIVMLTIQQEFIFRISFMCWNSNASEAWLYSI